MVRLPREALPKPMQVDRAEEINNKADSVLNNPVEEIRKVASGHRIKAEEILKADVPRIKEEQREVATGDAIIPAGSVVAIVARANAVAIIRAAATIEAASATAAIVLRDRAINPMAINPAIRHENSFCSMRHGSVAGGVWRQSARI